jgi:Uma2 family endonuclease
MTINVQQPRMDKAAFLAWAEAREERCELVGGRVVMMMRPMRAHALITGNLFAMLRDRLDRGRWSVLAEFGVEGGPATLRYPDIVVEPVDPDLEGRMTSAPLLIAEVLSPSTATVDLGDKAAEYLRLPSLVAYLVVAQDEPKVWAWLRNGDRFSPGPLVVEGLDASVTIPPLGLDLPLTEIFAGVLDGEQDATS